MQRPELWVPALAGMNNPRGVDCISHPGEREKYLGKSLLFLPVLVPPLLLSLELCLLFHRMALKGQRLAARQRELYSALVAQINRFSQVKGRGMEAKLT